MKKNNKTEVRESEKKHQKRAKLEYCLITLKVRKRMLLNRKNVIMSKPIKLYSKTMFFKDT